LNALGDRRAALNELDLALKLADKVTDWKTVRLAPPVVPEITKQTIIDYRASLTN
jgi:hypothetical protein